MFKAMLAAAGGTEKGSSVSAAKPPTNPPMKVGETAAKAALKSSSAQSQMTATSPAINSPKPRTFTQVKGHDFTTPKPTLPKSAPAKPKTVTSSRMKVTEKVGPKAVAVARVSKPAGRKSASATPVHKEPAPVAKPKKLNFMEIMNKAKEVSGDKLRMDVKTLSRDERERLKDQRKRSTNTPSPTQKSLPEKKAHMNAYPGSRSNSVASGPKKSIHKSEAAAPIAKPSAELLAKLKRRRQEPDEDDSELEDFVVNDEEVEYDDASSYRTQIWEALGRKPSQRYYDDESSDDMEATGADLLAEEARSARLARREDIEEEKKLQALAEAKAARKKKKTH